MATAAQIQADIANVQGIMSGLDSGNASYASYQALLAGLQILLQQVNAGVSNPSLAAASATPVAGSGQDGQAPTAQNPTQASAQAFDTQQGFP